MKKPEIWKLVLARLFPKQNDFTPSDWRSYIYRNLIEELNKEIIRFYGSNDCIESQNPGLDYANPAHRLRLACFPKHRQLFGIFDRLRLTDVEIMFLCTWNGTKFAKEKFERNHNLQIRDTTWDGVHPYSATRATVMVHTIAGSCHVDVDTGELMYHEMVSGDEDQDEGDGEDNDKEDDEEMENAQNQLEDEAGESEAPGDESEDELQQSVGVELNQRLLAATEARARGEDAPMDADWEQWMKEAIERGELPDVPGGVGSFSTPSEAARYLGREIPEIFNNSPSPQIAALQSQLPPPPPYYHQGTGSAPTAASIVQVRPPSETAM